MTKTDSLSTTMETVLAKAKHHGAEAADVIVVKDVSLVVGHRLGKVERIERSEGQDLGLRVLIGKRQAIVSGTDFSAKALDELALRAVAMAKTVPEDPYCGLALPEQLARDIPDLDGLDPVEPSVEDLTERVAAIEDAALSIKGVTNSDGAEAGWSRGEVAILASNGFHGHYIGSGHSVSVAVIAGTDDGMETGYDWTAATHGGDLRDLQEIGHNAGARAVARLGAQKSKTFKGPVVFENRIASTLVGHLAGAINGAAIARGTSFLKDHLGDQILAKGVSVIDDPHRRRGLRSKPFDAEGLPNRRRALIEDGILKTWVLDLRNARQLGLSSTGHASRGTSGPPSPSTTNLWIEAGTVTVDELIADIDEGLFVTSLFGQGVNLITGDYSRGASGFRIVKGKLAEPVKEATVAGNLKDMYLTLRPAKDLEWRSGSDAPTVRIDGMTVAGQ
ncbi:MAG: TldD/PmbA family protein [Alphaproteobacteria bacterium]